MNLRQILKYLSYKLGLVGLLSVVWLTGSGPVQAQTETGTLLVTARVFNYCSIASADGLNFSGDGSTEAVRGTTLDTTATVTVNCGGKASSWTVAFAAGRDGSISTRKVFTGDAGSTSGASIPYNLYSDSSHTALLGDGNTGSMVTGSNDGTLTVYGRLSPPDSALTPGVYQDEVVMTITF